MKTNHAANTEFVKPQVKQSRGNQSRKQSQTNHANHASDVFAGQAITHQSHGVAITQSTPL